MDHSPSSVQSSSVPVSTPPGILGTRIPSGISFVVVLILFLLPFLEIRCNGIKIQTVSGVKLATGFTSSNPGNDIGSLPVDGPATNASVRKQGPNKYALAALALGVLGLVFCIANKKIAAGGAMAAGVLGLAAMIGLWLDVKKHMNGIAFGDSGQKTTETGGDNNVIKEGIDKVTEGLGSIGLKVDFAPFFYVVMFAFAVGAVLSLLRMRQMQE